MSERLSSGHPRLDAVLGGGLPAHAHQHRHRAARHRQDDPGAAVRVRQRDAPSARRCTCPPCPSRSRRSSATARRSTSSRRRPSGRAVFYEDLGSILNDARPGRGLSSASTSCSRSAGPASSSSTASRRSRAYADDEPSFRALPARARRPAQRRSRRTRSGSASTTRTRSPSAPEFAVADAIIALATDRTAERETRVLRVLKLRGSGFRRASTPTGSRSAGSTSSRGWPTPWRSTTTRSAATGSPRASPRSTSCSATATGPAPRPSSPARRASGKTLMGLHFVFNGARAGEPGDHRHAPGEPDPARADRCAASAGALEEPGIELMYRSPVDLYIDEWVYDLLDTVERSRRPARR